MNNGRGFSLYLSGVFSYRYDSALDENNRWKFIPELSLFALNYRTGRGTSIEAGRIGFDDILGFTASGLFDGIRFATPLPLGTISASALYTGLQFKETAKIIMTDSDRINYDTPWEFDTFGDYFASKRIFAGVRWDAPLLDSMDFSAELIAQFDVNGNNEKLHSQYLLAQAEFYPTSMTRLTGGAALSAMQNGSGDFSMSFGLLARFKMALKGTAINDWLNFAATFTSASTGNAAGTGLPPAFTPISAIPQGYVFKGAMSGLTLIEADYAARLAQSLYAEGGARGFIRTYDTAGFGAELWASVTWQPFEDLRAALGGGVFFPVGNDNPFGSSTQWKINAGLTAAF